MNKFYKTFDERVLANIISGKYFEMVRDDENACEDENEYNGFTKPEEIASYILDQIMKCNGGDVRAEFNDELWALEPKHLRFMGKKRIEEIVNHRVAWMFKNFPPQY